MKVALERDLLFLSNAVLDRAVITPQLLSLLLQDSQQNMIVSLMTKSTRPQFISDQFMQGRKNKDGKQDYSLTKTLQFVDIIESMIDLDQHSNDDIKEMMRLMHNEAERV